MSYLCVSSHTVGSFFLLSSVGSNSADGSPYVHHRRRGSLESSPTPPPSAPSTGILSAAAIREKLVEFRKKLDSIFKVDTAKEEKGVVAIEKGKEKIEEKPVDG